MPTNKQRREAARRHLERQLERRAEREAARKRFALIASVVGGVLVIVLVVALVVVLGGNGNDKNPTASKTGASGSATPTTSTSPTTPSSSATPTYPPATGPAVKFDGVTVKGAADLAGEPQVTVHASADPTKLQYKDLVVGKGAAATPTSAVKAQYVGVIYKSGKIFQSSWKLGGPVPFTLGPGNVIDGFTQGIGGTQGVPPMKVGGRRIVIMPQNLAYGANPTPGSGIPKNAALVFVIDLTGLGS